MGANGPLREQKLLRPQLLNRVPQLGRFLELKALGGFAHVAFQFADVGIQFFLRLEFGHALGLAAGQVGVVGPMMPASDISSGRTMDSGVIPLSSL